MGLGPIKKPVFGGLTKAESLMSFKLLLNIVEKSLVALPTVVRY